MRELSAEADVVLVVGSRNSSNSQRLVEAAKGAGKRAYLIDDQSEVRDGWFAGKETVVITAGASAPDHLVRDLVDRLVYQFHGQVETRTLVEEQVEFDLPRSLKSLAVLE